MSTIATSGKTTAPLDERSVSSVSLSSPNSMTRKSRWKRRGMSKTQQRLVVAGGLAVLVASVVIIARLSTGQASVGPSGPFASALVDAFPEADSQRLAMQFGDDGELPLSATLHLPAHLLDSGRGIGDPFARLEAEFGGAERTLSGVEMAVRLEAIAAAVLTEGTVRCHTYKVGEISSHPDASRRTRALHIHLNPGC